MVILSPLLRANLSHHREATHYGAGLERGSGMMRYMDEWTLEDWKTQYLACHSNYLALCDERDRLRGERDYYIEQVIERWHNVKKADDLHNALGWTWEEYGKWLRYGECPDVSGRAKATDDE